MSKKVNLQTCVADVQNIENLLCNVAALWRRLLNSQIKSQGFSGMETRALVCIARNPGLTQIQIANLLDVEPQNLMRSLDKLESLSLIQKKSDANDRRIKCLTITPSAKKVIANIQAIGDNIRPHALSGIDDKKIQLTVDQLTKMRENLIAQLDREEKESK